MRWQVEEMARYMQEQLERFDPDDEENYLGSDPARPFRDILIAVSRLVDTTDWPEDVATRDKIWSTAAQVALCAMVYIRKQEIQRWAATSEFQPRRRRELDEFWSKRANSPGQGE